eukprot:4983999-Pyramimonas_sp.AAC.1
MGRDSTGRGGRQASETTTAAWSESFLSKTAAGVSSVPIWTYSWQICQPVSEQKTRSIVAHESLNFS